MMRLVVLIAVLWSGSAWAQNQSLNAYVNSLQVAPSLGPTDQFYIRQGGVSKQLLGSALPGMTYVQPYAYPFGWAPYNQQYGQGVVSGQIVPSLTENTAWTQPGVYPTQFIATNPYAIGYPGNTVTCSSCSGQIFQLNITSAQINGGVTVPISYTANGSDTSATIATALCNAVQSNPNLQNASTGLPMACDASGGGGSFNLTWSLLVQPITVTTDGSTGAISLNAVSNANKQDAVTYFFLREVSSSYQPQVGDTPVCASFGSQGATEMLQMCTVVSAIGASFASEISFGNLYNSALVNVLFLGQGLSLPDVNGNLPAFEGYGTINIPAVGGYYANGTQVISGSGLVTSHDVYGGNAANSSLILAGTSNGSPSGDTVGINTGGTRKLTIGGGQIVASEQLTILYGSPNITIEDSGSSYAYFQLVGAASYTTRVGTEGSAGSQLLPGTSAGSGVFATTTNTPLFFGTDGTIRAEIFSDGGFSIGSTPSDPGANNLYVQGTTTSGVVTAPGLIATAVAPTVASAQIGYGSTVAAASSCGSGGTGCIVVNIAGTTRYVPYY